VARNSSSKVFSMTSTLIKRKPCPLNPFPHVLNHWLKEMHPLSRSLKRSRVAWKRKKR
jgi:hypothetical protein